jgi:hypothetical protein
VTIRSGTTRTIDLVCEFAISGTGKWSSSRLDLRVVNFRVAKSRYCQDRWIEGGTQSWISLRVRFQSQGSI